MLSPNRLQLLLVLLIGVARARASTNLPTQKHTSDKIFQERQAHVCKWMLSLPRYSSSVMRSYVMRMWHAGKPFGVGCEELERYGRYGDGGKAVCEPKQLFADPACRVISVGSNGDASFEKAIHQKGGQHCAIDIYDGTLNEKKLTEIRNYAPFLNVTQSNFHNLSWVPYARSAAGPVVTMLKMDCEGCEFSTLRPWLEHVCAKQILIEVHGCKAPPAKVANATRALQQFYKKRLLQMHQLMTELYWYGYRVFHVEPNVEFSDGTCVEYSLRRITPCPTNPKPIRTHRGGACA